MLLTTEQAKTKRCQESFGDRNVSPAGYMVGTMDHPLAGTTSLHTSPANCIGSGCMAWRWSKTHNLGYCGKAGVP